VIPASALAARVATLETQLADFKGTMADVMRVTTDTFNTLADQRVDQSREQREELRDLKVEAARRSPSCTRRKGCSSLRAKKAVPRLSTCPAFCRRGGP
jgi:hypothetical protein